MSFSPSKYIPFLPRAGIISHLQRIEHYTACCVIRRQRLEGHNGMVDIPKKRMNGYLGSEFDEFLFATIGIDQRGRPLSVLSALARLDLDPWAEAARLARLPGETAAQKLTSWLSYYSYLNAEFEDRHKDALRLIGLLPKQVLIRAKAGNDKLSSYGLSNSYACLLAFLVTLSIILMVGLFSMKSPAGSPAIMTRSGGTAMPAVATPPGP